MKYTLKIKPYGENQKGDFIKDFDDDEWDMVVDLQERLIRNFKLTYPDIKFNTLTHDNETITMVFGNGSVLSEEKLEEYIPTLCGYNMENIIFFDDIEYYIRGEIIIDEKKKLTPFEKINLLTLEIAPELVDK